MPQDRQEIRAEHSLTCQDRAISSLALSQNSFLNEHYSSYFPYPGKPLIKLVLQSKEQALPEPVRIQSMKTYEWRRQALRSKNSHYHLPLMGITLDNLLLLLPFLSPGQNKEFLTPCQRYLLTRANISPNQSENETPSD